MNLTALDTLPAFADDRELGRALMGKRAGDWPHVAALLEGKGLPTIDTLMGGRYVPAVKAFFDRQNGLAAVGPKKPDGVEDLGAWRNRRRRG